MKIKKPHYAWVVLISAILIQGGFLGIVYNCIGVLFTAVIADLGFRSGDLSLFYMIRSLTSAVTVSATTRLFFRYRGRSVITILGLMYAGSVCLMSQFSSLWQWYFAAVVAGVGMSCVAVVIPIVINNWFHVHNALMIGIAMSASGLMGAIFNPIVANIISQYGWRVAAILMGIISGTLIIVPGGFLLRINPKDMGYMPLGQTTTGVEKASVIEGRTIQVRPWVFAVAAFGFALAAALIQMMNQLPIFTTSLGYTLHVGAVVTSCAMVGNVAGKILFGAITDKIGGSRTMQLMMFIVGLALIVFIVLPNIEFALYAAALLLGAVYSSGTIIPPILLLDLYGKNRYADKVSMVQMVNAVVGAVGGMIFPYLYDWTGTFKATWLFALLLCVLVIVSMQLLHKYIALHGKTDAQS